MWGKIRTIAGTSIYVAYTDIGALFFILALPVLLSVVIGLAFGEGDNTIDLGTAELVIINQDETQALDGPPGTPQREINWGQQMYAAVLVDDVPPALDELIDAELATDEAAARQQVEDGDRDAVLIIPAAFTANVLNPAAQGSVELFYNPANEVTATVLISVIEQLTAQLNAGQSAQDILVGIDQPFLIQKGVQQGADPATIGAAADATLTAIFSEGVAGLVTLRAVDIEGEESTFDSLRYFAPSMALLFMTFAMATGMRSILEENRNWTMQRLLTTPTPRWAYMTGKMLGTVAIGVIQMLLLLIITSVVAVIMGRDGAVWGTNVIGIALAIVFSVLAASGLGLLLTAISSSVRQADNMSGAVLIVMAMIGGTFVPVDANPVLDALSNISLNKWGIESFITLSDDGSVADILTNIAVLFGMSVAFFGIALWRFNTRNDF